MIDTDDQRDYAEEAYWRTTQEQERAEEQAFETRQIKLAAALRDLSNTSQRKARDFARQINASIEAKALPPASHLLMMKRAATVAHMAERAALTVERAPGYDLRGAVDAQLRAICADDPNGVGSFARTRVDLVVRQTLDAEAEAAFAASSGHED